MLLLSPGWLPRTQVGKQEPLNGPFEQLALICLGQKVNWSTALDMGTLGERFPLMPKGPVGSLARPRNLSPRGAAGRRAGALCLVGADLIGERCDHL